MVLGAPLTIEVHAGRRWGATVRPRMPQAWLEPYLRGKDHVSSGRIVDGTGHWQDLDERARQQATPHFLAWIRLRIGDAWSTELAWDEALDTVAGKFKEAQEKYGAESILLGQGTGRDFESHFSRLGNMLGTPNMITAGHMCYLSRIAATLTTCGRHPAIDYAGNPKCIVMWGCNPLWTNPDEYKGVSFWRAYQKGAKLIVIDPRKGFLAKRADLWLQVRPGTDAALALGFHNVIIEEELYDKEFVTQYVHGWDRFVERVKNDYPLDLVEKITWVDRDLIRRAARLYATTKPAGIHWGVPTEQNINCTDFTRAAVGLMAATGNLDAPGGNVFHQPPGTRSISEFSNHKALAPEQRAKQLGGDKYRLASRMTIITPKCAWDAILKEEPYPIKVGYLVGTNPVVSRANASEVYDALNKLEFLAVSDFFLPPTAELRPLTDHQTDEDQKRAQPVDEFVDPRRAVPPVLPAQPGLGKRRLRLGQGRQRRLRQRPHRPLDQQRMDHRAARNDGSERHVTGPPEHRPQPHPPPERGQKRRREHRPHGNHAPDRERRR